MGFYDEIDAMYGNNDDLTDLNVIVRRCWFYDFVDEPVRLWEGQGNITTEDGNVWLGTITPNGENLHKTPQIQDGRDGTSATYRFSLVIPEMIGQDRYALYDALKSEQAKAYGRPLTCYLVLFDKDEGLRPSTPITFFKQLTMFSPTFEEEIVAGREEGSMEKVLKAKINAKDGNFGRSEQPNGTYADAIQKERARQKGVTLDRGAEHLAGLANRTYVIE